MRHRQFHLDGIAREGTNVGALPAARWTGTQGDLLARRDQLDVQLDPHRARRLGARPFADLLVKLQDMLAARRLCPTGAPAIEQQRRARLSRAGRWRIPIATLSIALIESLARMRLARDRMSRTALARAWFF